MSSMDHWCPPCRHCTLLVDVIQVAPETLLECPNFQKFSGGSPSRRPPLFLCMYTHQEYEVPQNFQGSMHPDPLGAMNLYPCISVAAKEDPRPKPPTFTTRSSLFHAKANLDHEVGKGALY